MPTTIKLGPFFDKAKRDRAISNGVSKTIRQFARYVPEQQLESQPTGKVYGKGRGRGFTRSHRASARGQRPAPDSGKLIRSTKHKKTGTFKGEVETVAKNKGFDYAAQLQNKMDRPIQNAPKDIATAQRMLDSNCEKELNKIR